MTNEELIALLNQAQKELEKAKNNLDEAFKELNEMYNENLALQKDMRIAKFLLADLNARNEELERENKLLKEFMLNE